MKKFLAHVLARSIKGIAVQGFAPKQLVSISSSTQDTTNWVAFCFPNIDVDYQLNAAGEVVTLPAGSVRVVDNSITSIAFTIVGTAKCEVM